MLQEKLSLEIQWETIKSQQFSLQTFDCFKDEVGDERRVLWLESYGKICDLTSIFHAGFWTYMVTRVNRALLQAGMPMLFMHVSGVIKQIFSSKSCNHFSSSFRIAVLVYWEHLTISFFCLRVNC